MELKAVHTTVQLKPESYKLFQHPQRGPMCISELFIYANGDDTWGFDLNGRANPHEDALIAFEGPESVGSYYEAVKAAEDAWRKLPPWTGFNMPDTVQVNAHELKSLLTKMCCYCAPELHAEALAMLVKLGIP